MTWSVRICSTSRPTAALKKGQKGKSMYNKLVVISQVMKQHGKAKLLNAADWPSFVETVRPIYEDFELAKLFRACTKPEEVRFKFYLMSGFRDAEALAIFFRTLRRWMKRIGVGKSFSRRVEWKLLWHLLAMVFYPVPKFVAGGYRGMYSIKILFTHDGRGHFLTPSRCQHGHETHECQQNHNLTRQTFHRTAS